MVAMRGRLLTVAVCFVGLTACMPTVGGTDLAAESAASDPDRLAAFGDDTVVGEIRLFGGQYAPFGWTYADGRELQTSRYQRLFEVLGTTYGGDGKTSFRLPELPIVKAGNRAVAHLIAWEGKAPRYEGQNEGISEGVLGEVRLWPIEKTPVGWLPCDGAELSIANHQALHAVLGTTYGGDGLRTFKLPHLPPAGQARYLINVAGQFPVSGDGEPSTERMIGEISLFAGQQAPAGLAFCEGQTMPIVPNTALYSVLGLSFGGNGIVNFGLPSLAFADQSSLRYAIAHKGYYPVHP